MPITEATPATQWTEDRLQALPCKTGLVVGGMAVLRVDAIGRRRQRPGWPRLGFFFKISLASLFTPRHDVSAQ